MKKIKKGTYLYKGYRVQCIPYYHPDRRTVWEAFNDKTGEADYHAYTKRDIKKAIDNDIESEVNNGI